MGLVVSEDALKKLQALMDQGLTFITSSLSFSSLSVCFFLSHPFFFSFFLLLNCFFLVEEEPLLRTFQVTILVTHSHMILTFYFLSSVFASWMSVCFQHLRGDPDLALSLFCV